MAAVDLAREYISRVNGQEAEGVAELFAEDGEILDPMGVRHQGRSAIAEFIAAAPPGTIAQIADRDLGEDRIVFRGTVTTGQLAPAETEWDFQVADEHIKQLTIRMLNAPGR